MLISELMTPQPLTVQPQDPITAAIRIIIDLRFSGLPVVDQEMKVVGMISEKDIAGRLLPGDGTLAIDTLASFDPDLNDLRRQALDGLLIKDVMVSPVFTLRESDHILQALISMTQNHVRRLPVVDANDRLTGIVSQGDLFRVLLSQSIQHN